MMYDSVSPFCLQNPQPGFLPREKFPCLLPKFTGGIDDEGREFGLNAAAFVFNPLSDTEENNEVGTDLGEEARDEPDSELDLRRSVKLLDAVIGTKSSDVILIRLSKKTSTVLSSLLSDIMMIMDQK